MAEISIVEEKIIAKLEDFGRTITEIRIALTRMEASIEAARAAREDQKEKIALLEEDMRALQKRINYAAGAVAVIVGSLSFVWQLLSRKLGI